MTVRCQDTTRGNYEYTKDTIEGSRGCTRECTYVVVAGRAGLQYKDRKSSKASDDYARHGAAPKGSGKRLERVRLGCCGNDGEPLEAQAQGALALRR